MGLKVKVDELEVALNETSGESSTLSIDLAGFKSKLAMVEEALEQARTQSSEYEGELARAREALENEVNEKRLHGGEVLEDVRGAVSAEHASVAGSRTPRARARLRS